MSEENREAAQLPDKYAQAIAASNVVEDDRQVADAVAKILADHYQENNNKEVYRFLFNSIDLTTLKSTDSPQSVARFTEAVNSFAERGRHMRISQFRGCGAHSAGSERCEDCMRERRLPLVADI